jgi:hypothetical protein
MMGAGMQGVFPKERTAPRRQGRQERQGNAKMEDRGWKGVSSPFFAILGFVFLALLAILASWRDSSMR